MSGYSINIPMHAQFLLIYINSAFCLSANGRLSVFLSNALLSELVVLFDAKFAENVGITLRLGAYILGRLHIFRPKIGIEIKYHNKYFSNQVSYDISSKREGRGR